MTIQSRGTTFHRTTRSMSIGSRSVAGSESGEETLLSSDHEVTEQSDTPEEDFGEAEDDLEWPVKAVVGEETLLNRQKRYLVEWSGWQRIDGTTTTWQVDLPGGNNLLENWKSKRKGEKRKIAQNPEIDLAVLDKYKPHNIRTAEDAVAYEEKRKKNRAFPAYWDKWLAMDGAGPQISPCISRKRRTRDWSESRSRESGSRQQEEDMVLVGSSVVAHQSRNSPAVPIPTQSRTRGSIQIQWATSIFRTGAEKLTIVNDMDGEEFPPIGQDFEYLENRCEYKRNVPNPNAPENKDFLVGCGCLDDCSNPLTCSCLLESQCVGEHEEESPAYDENGLFLFNNRREVVECNEKCECRRNCNNAVAQRPRKIPIEVFKTHHNGWGARSPISLRRGTVLGPYTGTVIKREELKCLSAEAREYTFDLDLRDGEAGLEEYSLDAYSSGNWTRFVNHSCDANAMVYSVVFDTAIAANMPYIVLVASKDIPAREEITIDYNPSAARKKKGRKGKGKGKANEGRTRCFCGTVTCREFI